MGETLWPGYWPKHELAQKRADPLLYQTLQQQVPVAAEGSWLGSPNNIIVSQEVPALA